MYAVLVLVCLTGCLVHAGDHHHHHHDSTGPSTSHAPMTTTPAGRVRGSWLYSRRGHPIRAFRGIRYAAPPTGSLRFQPPQPITNYTDEVDATKDGPACPQPTIGDYYVDEDCLRLNVYTPKKISPSKPLPVVVFFHAGGFYSISGRSDVVGPEYLLDRQLVLVSVNYRLASLGFLSTHDKLAPGNNGFKDQVVALRWIARNIAAFGGDPNLVTIAGYSAGSFSVMLHMVSPMSKGLFHRAISMSGSPISQVQLPHHQHHLAVRQAQLLNCPTTNSKVILDCLRGKTSKELGDSLDQFFDFGYDPVLIWIPIIEKDYGQERFLEEHPLESIKHGRVHSVPYIVSQTQDEFFWKAFTVLNNSTMTSTMDSEWRRIAPISFYLPEPSQTSADTLREHYIGPGPLRNDTRTAGGLGTLYSDAIIGFGVHTLVNAMSVYTTVPLYYYEFGYVGNRSHYEDPDTKKPIGAMHHDDLIYLFSINASFPFIVESDSHDSRQVDRMTRLWWDFATTGDPNPTPSPELPVHWPQFNHNSRQYLRIDTQYSIREKLFEDRFQVWEKLFNSKDCL